MLFLWRNQNPMHFNELIPEILIYEFEAYSSYPLLFVSYPSLSIHLRSNGNLLNGPIPSLGSCTTPSARSMCCFSQAIRYILYYSQLVFASVIILYFILTQWGNPPQFIRINQILHIIYRWSWVDFDHFYMNHIFFTDLKPVFGLCSRL